MLILFFKALIVGFVAAAPVGPIGFLCISRVLEVGYIAGIITGLGAATADGIYGCIGGLGVGLIAEYLAQHDFAIRLFSSVILIFLGIHIFFKKLSMADAHAKKEAFKPWVNYMATFLLTLTNPMTILSFGAIFTALKLPNVEQTAQNTLILGIGVMLGSMLWWCILTLGIGLLKRRIRREGALQWINYFAGGIVIILAFVAFYANSL